MENKLVTRTHLVVLQKCFKTFFSVTVIQLWNPNLVTIRTCNDAIYNVPIDKVVVTETSDQVPGLIYMCL